MIPTVTVKWAVEQPYVGGSLVGTFPTREEAQAVADSQDLPTPFTSGRLRVCKLTGCGGVTKKRSKATVPRLVQRCVQSTTGFAWKRCDLRLLRCNVV